MASDATERPADQPGSAGPFPSPCSHPGGCVGVGVTAPPSGQGHHDSRRGLMATTAPTVAGGFTLPLARIHVPENVRALNAEHVDALAASIALQGMLVPIVICPAQDDVAADTGFEYELVAGFH